MVSPFGEDLKNTRETFDILMERIERLYHFRALEHIQKSIADCFVMISEGRKAITVENITPGDFEIPYGGELPWESR